ncbi:uncharacterized protein LOC134815050 [Bolinopsis microptera]|uniref:uncharacterized protein LOC134815050 n=1 Tax=Bolinopsis microptera TaxID=2820187 RepID=UPI00307B035A
MKTLDNKIAMLEEMIGDPDKLNKAVYDVITGSDMNNDECLSKAEFQKVLQDFGIGDFDAIEDLFESLDRDGNGSINFKEFRHFFRAQTRIKLQHMKELKAMKDRTKVKNQIPVEDSSSSSSDDEKKKPKFSFKKWKSTRN